MSTNELLLVTLGLVVLMITATIETALGNSPAWIAWCLAISAAISNTFLAGRVLRELRALRRRGLICGRGSYR
jgi:hypothetical protein